MQSAPVKPCTICSSTGITIKAHEETTNHQESANSVPLTPAPAPDVVPNATTETNPEPVKDTNPAFPKHKADPEIIKLLTAAGVAHNGAIELARAHPAIRCWDGIEYVQRRINQGDPIATPGGYIRRAIEQGWVKPSVTPENPHKSPRQPHSSPEFPENDAQKQPQKPRSQLVPTPDPPEKSPISEFEQARQTSPHADTWEKALDHMRDFDNPDTWIQPLTVSALAESVYISSIQDQTVHLIAYSDFQAETVRRVADRIQKALRTVGLEFNTIVVEALE